MGDVKTPQEMGKDLDGHWRAHHATSLSAQAMHNQATILGAEMQGVIHDLYEAHTKGLYQYGVTVQVCLHPSLRARNGGGVECPSCGIVVSDLALKRIGTPRYDEARMKLADECGRLRSENDALLRENRALRLRAEAAERRRR